MQHPNASCTIQHLFFVRLHFCWYVGLFFCLSECLFTWGSKKHSSACPKHWHLSHSLAEMNLPVRHRFWGRIERLYWNNLMELSCKTGWLILLRWGRTLKRFPKLYNPRFFLPKHGGTLVCHLLYTGIHGGSGFKSWQGRVFIYKFEWELTCCPQGTWYTHGMWCPHKYILS